MKTTGHSYIRYLEMMEHKEHKDEPEHKFYGIQDNDRSFTHIGQDMALLPAGSQLLEMDCCGGPGTSASTHGSGVPVRQQNSQIKDAARDLHTLDKLLDNLNPTLVGVGSGASVVDKVSNLIQEREEWIRERYYLSKLADKYFRDFLDTHNSDQLAGWFIREPGLLESHPDMFGRNGEWHFLHTLQQLCLRRNVSDQKPLVKKLVQFVLEHFATNPAYKVMLKQIVYSVTWWEFTFSGHDEYLKVVLSAMVENEGKCKELLNGYTTPELRELHDSNHSHKSSAVSFVQFLALIQQVLDAKPTALLY
eukprot:972793_1